MRLGPKGLVGIGQPRGSLVAPGMPGSFGVSRPGWIMPGASIDLDFAHSRYYGGSLSSLLSLSRASTGYAQTAAGVWQSFGSNVLRITDQGLLIEEARTNKCTNFNANPTDLTNVTKSGDAAATLTVVDDTAALAAAGLQNIATSGKVFKLDNSAGSTSAQINFVGGVSNTNAQSISAYIRGGTGSVGLNLGSSLTAYGASATYVRRSSVNKTPDATGRFEIVIADPGQTVFVILNQLEEGSFITSPIVTAGASATRAADIPQLTGAAAAAALQAKAAFFQTFGVQGITNNARLLSYANANMTMASTTTARIDDGSGNTSVATIGGAGTVTGTVKSAFGFDASGSTAVANGGTKATNATFNYAGGVVGPVYIGNLSNGLRALNGYMQRFALSLTKGQFDGMTA